MSKLRISEKQSYRKTVKQIRLGLPFFVRPFSWFLHLRLVEDIADMLANTLFRPLTLITGSVGLIVVALPIYIIARLYGYGMSGFEPIAGFLAGWFIGIVFEYIHLLLTNRHN